PFSKHYLPMGLSGQPVRNTLPEDPQCPADTMNRDCVDPRRASRLNRGDIYDRYAVLEYHTQFAQQKAGLTARAYLQQFVRGFEPLQVLAASSTLPGGLSFRADLTAYRAGGAFDGDIELAPLRVLYGAEAFHEWKPEQTAGSLQGRGTPSTLTAPYNLGQ